METRDNLHKAIEAERKVLDNLMEMADGTHTAIDMFTQTEKLRIAHKGLEEAWMRFFRDCHPAAIEVPDFIK